MTKRRGGRLPRVMPSQKRPGLDIRMVIPGLPIAAPDPLAVSLGGSETAGLQLAAELVRQGHQVTMFANVQRPFAWKGVRLAGEMSGEVAGRPCDLFLVQRWPELLQLRRRATAAMLWVHSLATTETARAMSEHGHLADRIVTVSEWQTQRYQTACPGIAASRYLTARNGIDLDLIREATSGVDRDPFRILYTSRPERGLEVLIRGVLPRILEQEPRASLHVTSYDYPGDGWADYHQLLRRYAEPFGDRIVWHPPLGKRDLYRLMAGSGLYLYPTPAPIDLRFAETSCITAMEAMACGLPWMSTDRGALPETVGEAGVLVPLGGAMHAAEPAVAERLVAEALRVMRDEVHADRLRAAGLARAQGLGWAPVAEQITAAITSMQRSPAPSSASRASPASPAPKQTLMIATPAYGGTVTCGYTAALLMTAQVLTKAGIQMALQLLPGQSLVQRARNLMAAWFLADPALTHLMWIDADIKWAAEDVLRLIEHDLDVVCGIYPKKTLDGQRFPFQSLPNPETAPRLPNGCVEIKSAPTGFMMIKREVFLRLIEAYPESKIRVSFGDDDALPWLYDFFPAQLEDGELLSEDFGFCKRWRAIGGRVWADPAIQLGHVGTYTFTGDPMTVFAPARRVGEAA